MEYGMAAIVIVTRIPRARVPVVGPDVQMDICGVAIVTVRVLDPRVSVGLAAQTVICMDAIVTKIDTTGKDPAVLARQEIAGAAHRGCCGDVRGHVLQVRKVLLGMVLVHLDQEANVAAAKADSSMGAPALAEDHHLLLI